MPILHGLLRLLGFRNTVRIEGKGFFNLTPQEAAEMIDVHLGRTGRFEPEALYEFYAVPNRGRLEELRLRLLAIQVDCAEPDQPDGLSTREGRAALATLADELRT